MADSIVLLTEENFTSETSTGITLVDFYADWCGPCKMITPIIEELSQELTDVKIAKVDIDTNQTVTGNFNVTSVPTIVILKDGQEVERVVGVKSKEDLTQLINSIR